jgi:hypothetical protein
MTDEPTPTSPIWRNMRTLVIVFTVLFEAITCALRFGGRVSAEEFNQSVPLLLQIHHMFWSLPIFVVAWLVRRRPRVCTVLVAIGIACITSDLMHHFIVLPLTVGNTGWHWP